MAIEIKAPTLPESVPDGTIATWYKNVGDKVSRDELLVDIETDKVVIEVASPADGTMEEIFKNSGDIIVSNEAIGSLLPGEATAAAEPELTPQIAQKSEPAEAILSPAAKKLLEENALSADEITGSGKDGRITKEDVVNHLAAAEVEQSTPLTPNAPDPVAAMSTDGRLEERVPMSRPTFRPPRPAH